SPPPSLRLLQAKLSQNSNHIARGRIRRFESYMPSHAVWSPLRGAPDMARTVERPRHPQVPSPRHHLLDRGTCTRLPGDRVRCHVLDDGSVIVANSDFWAMLLLSCTTAITGGMHGKEDQV